MSSSFRRARDIALKATKKEITDDQAAARIEEVLKSVPMKVAAEGVHLQGLLHSRSLSTILICCFLIESYANSCAHYLLGRNDIPEEQRRKLASHFGQGEKTRTQDKWAILGSVEGQGFDRSKSPFQDFVVLFHFRDDVVHDKPVPWGVDRQGRYGGQLADPVLGLLALKDALFAADVYWALVTELHRLTRSAENFHAHYNLQPWFGDEHRKSLRALAKQYVASGVQRK